MKKEKKPKKEKAEKTGKGGKKKLLLIPIVLVAVAALAAVVVLFVLPKFGIQLLGGADSGDSSQVGDPLPKKGLTAYTVGEDTVASLDTVIEEGEGELIANRGPGKRRTMEDGSGEVQERYTYIYEMESFAPVVDRYLDLMLGEEGFSLVDEEYLIQEERPELEDAEGALILAKASVVEGHIFQIVIGWSQASANLAVRVSAPEGALRHPEPENGGGVYIPPEPASLEEHLDQLMSVPPSRLGLKGESMEEYEVYAMVGFVSVDGIDCRRFTVYSRENPGTIEGIFLISADQQHFYELDPETNTVTELR